MLEGRVRALSGDGDAVVETAEGIVLAPSAVPGERVRLLDVRREGKVRRAQRSVVLEPAAGRVDPACALPCGGCPWRHAAAEVQLDQKRARVEHALGPLGPVSISIRGPGDRWAYRRRARLSWQRTGQGLILGFRAWRRQTVADVEHCAVLLPVLDAALALVRARVGPSLPGSGELQLALGADGLPVITIETEAAPPRAAYAALEALVAEARIAGASVRAGGASVAALIGAPEEHGTDIEGRPLVGPPGGFSQAHGEINAALGLAVLELAGPLADRRVLELHAGSGNLTLALAARAARVRAVERSAPAAEALRRNLAAHDLGADVITGDAATSAGPGPADLVVLDPPRTGAKDAMDALCRLGAPRVVYVSCDPATLARDLGLLAGAGYRLDAARAFDMFPQTPHVEVVARMVR